MKSYTLIIAVLGLSACTPTMMAPPAAPLDPTHSRSFGLGYTAHKQSISSAERAMDGDSPIMSGGQFWLRRKSKPLTETEAETESGLLISFGMTSFGAAGTYYRRRISGLPESVYIGTQLEWGWIWGGAALPIGVRLFDFWFYMQPTIRYPAYLMAHLPFGLSIDLGDKIRLDVQGGISAFGLLIGKTSPGSPFHDRSFTYGALGLSHHW